MTLTESSQPPAFLIIGGDGLIGGALTRKIRAEQHPVLSTSRRSIMNDANALQFDLAGNTENLFLDPRVAELAKSGTLTTFLAAAVTGISECTKDPTGSRLVNVTNTVSVARELMALGSAVVFISSNAVFSGKIPGPTDSTEMDPNTDYGCQKAEAEKMLREVHAGINDAPPLMIVRLTKVLVNTLPLMAGWIERLQAGVQIDAFNDRYFSPISLERTVESLLKIGKSGRSGIYHVTGSRDLTYYDFARLLAASLGVRADLVNPVEADAKVIGLVQKYSALGQTNPGLILSLDPEEPEFVAKSLNL